MLQEHKRDAVWICAYSSIDRYSDRHVIVLLLCAVVLRCVALCYAVLAVEPQHIFSCILPPNCCCCIPVPINMRSHCCIQCSRTCWLSRTLYARKRCLLACTKKNARQCMVQRSTARHSAAQRGTSRHRTAGHDTARHCTELHRAVELAKWL